MNPLPNDWLALLAVVYALGLKHGMDRDHLAIARHTAERELLLGCAAVAIVGLSFLVGLRLAPATASATAPQVRCSGEG